MLKLANAVSQAILGAPNLAPQTTTTNDRETQVCETLTQKNPQTGGDDVRAALQTDPAADRGEGAGI